ncbi:DUF4241 domain-containing protein [Streptomyces sp. NPDC059396]|uniref:DUF4241 domain-containing protein n=1 Tax=Streptomyces sp. NPDC059396 TaxID=3346819 RepID=UPI0036C14099
MIIDVMYGEDWDPVTRTVVGPIGPRAAAARDAAGAPYAVILRAPGRPQPVAVLHIAWAHRPAGYLGIWAYDDQGRRTREIDIRRLRPDRLFLRRLAQWRYGSPELPEFAGTAGRVRIDLHPDGTSRRVSEPRGDAGPARHTVVQVPGDRSWEPVPAFGEWGPVAATMTGDRTAPVELRTVPDPQGSPGVRSWHPPRPMRPRHLAEMFTVDTRFTPPPGDRADRYAVRRVIDAGLLRLPSGCLIACDPYDGNSSDAPAVFLRPGGYRVEIAVAAYPVKLPGHWRPVEEYAAARVVVSQNPTAYWEPATGPGQDVRLLRDGEFHGFAVGSGTGCFADASAERLLSGKWASDVPHEQDGITVRRDPVNGAGLIAFPSGRGDGSYPLWVGRDARGDITCVVADMLILHRAEIVPCDSC